LLWNIKLGYNSDVDTLKIIGAKYLIFAIVFIALAATLLSKRTIRNNIVKLALFSFPIALLMAFIGGLLFYDTRPFVAEDIEPLISHQPDNGFPSQHTLLAMTTAATIFVYIRQLGALLVILAVFVGVSRVLAGVHYPIDIVASIAIAVAATFIAWVLLAKLFERKKTHN
jgi:undecaprenyl-diphosphatase